ncbi:unnamed protein product [marine sediment metagenome]|uniref:Uncharacterized protein n=1 Tax=marine sediment metagenome TaxID=412755 RepID=X1HAB6_9ZZZZ
MNGPGGVSPLTIAPDDLKDLLIPVERNPLEYNIKGYSGYKYIPDWKINTESFTCFPVIQS